MIYLASQIRQNSKLQRASTASVSLETNNRMSILAAEDPELTRIFWEGLADRSALSTSDSQRFDFLVSVFMGGVQQEHQFAQNGVIAPQTWEARVRGTRWIIGYPGMQQWWSLWQTNYPDSFVAFMDGLIRESNSDS